MKLSFLFVGDGPCGESDWRPAEDRTQWWGRRDALARICTMAIWPDFGYRARESESENGHDVASCCFCFSDGMRSSNAGESTKRQNSSSSSSSKGTENSAGCETVTYLADAAAARRSVPVPTESAIVAMFKESTKIALRPSMGKLVAGKLVKETNWMSCNKTPWLESPLLTTKQLQQNFSPPAHHNSDFDGSSAPRRDNLSAGKRELVARMQKECPIDFLRQHGLNGSLDLVLKKKNKTAVDEAFLGWRTTSSSAPSVSSTAEIDVNCREGRLKHTFAGLIASLASGVKDTNNKVDYSRVCILILHEDYGTELPVFGHPDAAPYGPDGGLLICCMGAVRDMADEETAALFWAAKALGVRVVGCHLGRTAEFTSKIVAALVGHLRAGVLSSGVNRLLQRYGDQERQHMELLRKLTPLRGWSWNGYSNTAKRENTDVAKEEAAALAPIQPVCVHPVLWTDMLPSAVTTDPSKREQMMHIIQAVVCSLWRSRISNEQHDSCNEAPVVEGTDAKKRKCRDDPEELRCPPIDPTVTSKLSLIFADGSVATLDQQTFTSAMARKHMAAPSEYQVLLSLTELLQSPDVWSEGSLGKSSIFSVLSKIFPSGIKRKHLKSLRILDVIRLDANCADLSAHIYSRHCQCDNEQGAVVHDGSKRFHILVLLNVPKSCDQSATKSMVNDAISELYVQSSKVTDERQHNADRRCPSVLYLKANVLRLSCSSSSVAGMTPGTAVTLIQHWAYHGRLCDAIHEAVDSESCDICGVL
jgi:hypothetical protein